MEQILTQITSDLENYYAEASEKQSAAMQVGWRDPVAQRRRFAALTTLLPEPEPFTINDLGCGQGDLLDFLTEHGYSAVDYTGYDVIEEMVDAARRKHQGQGRNFTLLCAAPEMNVADFTVASGIFNLRSNLRDDAWFEYIIETIHHMNTKSRLGFAFNCLTKYSDPPHMKPDLYYADPLTLFDYCKKHFSRNVALLHDYEEFDFTIIVRK
jgi:SAM-dependent methyltransferase